MKTIQVLGIGPVEIRTDLDVVQLVGALTVTGDPVNCRAKKVSRSKAAARKAATIDAAQLIEIRRGYFMLVEGE